jgi:pimeloyl-ACP methyl ester carboxylesterase
MNIEIISRYPKNKTYSTPILFVHGAFAGAWCWEKYFLPYFAEHGYASHGLSLRGHGNSEGKPWVWFNSIDDYLDDLSQVIRKFYTPPVLVGHSMGGLIVQKYLESSPAPAGILLASIPHTGLIFASMRMYWHHPLLCHKIHWINVLPEQMWKYFTTPEEMRDIFFSKAVPPETVEKYSGYFQRESYRAMWEMSWLPFLPRPYKVKTPLLILGASEDIIIPPDFVESTAAAYNSKAQIFSNMGHAMMLDTGWKEVADQIRHWLGELKIEN